MVETPTAERIHSEPYRLWRIVTDYPDIFDSLIVPKLNGNDVKFFYDCFFKKVFEALHFNSHLH